jgi:hypothetical protein
VAVLPFLAHAGLVAAIWPWTRRWEPRPTFRLLASLIGAAWLIVMMQLALAGGLIAPAPLRLATLGLVAALTGGAWFAARRWPLPPSSARVPRGWLERGLVAFTALVYLVLLGIALLAPSTAEDTLNYHLTAILHAAQTHGLDGFHHPSRQFFYPQAAELQGLWYYEWSGATSSSLLVAGAALLPAGLIAGVAVRAAAEALGLRRCLPWLAPAMMLAPSVLIQAISGYVDAAFAGFVLAAVAFALAAATGGRAADLGWCAVAAGLALGVKLTFLFYGLPIVALLLSPPVLRAVRAGGWRRASWRVVVGVALFLSASGWWIGRNWRDTGNPLYPNPVRVAGHTLFAGPASVAPRLEMERWFVPSTAAWVTYPFAERFQQATHYTTENGFGPLYAPGLIATVLGLAIAARRRRWLVVRALLATPLTLLPWLTINPYITPRYVIATLGFGLLALAYLLELVDPDDPGEPRPARRDLARVVHAVIVAAVVLGALAGVAASRLELPTVLARWRRGDWTPMAYAEVEDRELGRAFAWLDAHAAPGRVVSFTNDCYVAPLFGWAAESRVVYAPFVGDDALGAMAHVVTYRAWRRFLREERVDWLVVWNSFHQPNRRPERWLAAHPADFELVADFHGRASIYRPVFHDDEVGAGGGAEDARGELDDPAAWALAFADHGTAAITGGRGDVDIAFDLTTPANSWVDVSAALEPAAPPRTLRFHVALTATLPTLLFVYLKGADDAHAARYPVDLAALGPGSHEVTLDLAAPAWRSDGFSTADLAELHLVLDDANDADAGRGTLRVSGFRFAP